MYIKKPLAVSKFRSIVLLTSKSLIRRKTNIIGKSMYIKNLMKNLSKISILKAPILILGESGSGKEMIARTIHFNSLGGGFGLNVINCTAIPKTLIESELFGYMKGSFTGAVEDRIGKLEAAEGGTLFLDEIGELENSTQVKLLRFIETQEVCKLGSSKVIKINTRLLFATNKNLNFMVNCGLFRIDFLFRINTLELLIPSLRNRKLDIVYFIRKFLNLNQKLVLFIRKNIIKFLLIYSWRGNIRELRNFCFSVLHHNNNSKLKPSKLPYSYILYYYI